MSPGHGPFAPEWCIFPPSDQICSEATWSSRRLGIATLPDPPPLHVPVTCTRHSMLPPTLFQYSGGRPGEIRVESMPKWSEVMTVSLIVIRGSVLVIELNRVSTPIHPVQP